MVLAPKNDAPFLGPAGAGLPKVRSPRWTPHAKAHVINAVENGVVSLEDIVATYELTAEEIESWRRRYNVWGLRGLQVTRRLEAR